MTFSELNNFKGINGVFGTAYRNMHHLVSDSEWDARAVMDQAAKDVSQCLPAQRLTGLLIDEGGRMDKTSNSQAAVFGCLCNGKYASLVDSRLYLPKSWTSDVHQCQEAGIPIGERTFKTKPELALEIIKHQTALGVHFDYIGADKVYGRDFNFARQIDNMGIFYMLEVHSDQELYLGKPGLYRPQHKSGGNGLNLGVIQTTAAQYIASLEASEWKNLNIRDSAKDVLKGKFHFKKVYVWDKTTDTIESRLLVASKRKSSNGEELKFSFTNAPLLPYTEKPIAYMQAHRFLLEHNFKEQKQIMEMDQFRTHKWLSWYHQIALNILVGCFKLKEQLLNRGYSCYQPGI